MDKRTLGELLECSVCLESFDEYNNKVLPCQHTFCRLCLDSIISVENRLVCPECRLAVDTRVDDLPSNVLLNRILSTLKNPQSQHDRHNYKERRRRRGLSSLVDYGMKEMNIPCAKALYNYKALENGDLSFKKDDVIELLYRVDRNWFVGKLDGRQGFMPSNYIQILHPLPSRNHTCRAVNDFSIVGGDKIESSFNKNGGIDSIGSADNRWLEESCHQKGGIFQETFVLDTKSRLLLLQNKLVSNVMSHRGLSDEHQSMRNDNNTGSYSHSTTTTTTTTTNESLMMNSMYDLMDEDRGSESSIQMTSSSYPNLVESSKSFSSETEATDRIEATGRKPQQLEERLPSYSAADLSLGADGVLPLYQAMSEYRPKSREELDLEVGKMYVALRDKGGGWVLGKSVARGTVGLFPLKYVKFLKNWNYLDRDAHQGRPIKDLPPPPTSLGKNSVLQQSESCDDLPPFRGLRDCRPEQKRRSVNVESFLPSSSSLLSSSSSSWSPSSSDKLNGRDASTIEVNAGRPSDLRLWGRACQGVSPVVVGGGGGGGGGGGDRVAKSHTRLSSIAYGVSSLVHRNMVRQKTTTGKRCTSASTSRCK